MFCVVCLDLYEREDVADEILQEEEPKEPRIDVYYVIMAIIMGSVLMGLLLYFAGTVC